MNEHKRAKRIFSCLWEEKLCERSGKGRSDLCLLVCYINEHQTRKASSRAFKLFFETPVVVCALGVKKKIFSRLKLLGEGFKFEQTFVESSRSRKKHAGFSRSPSRIDFGSLVLLLFPFLFKPWRKNKRFRPFERAASHDDGCQTCQFLLF